MSDSETGTGAPEAAASRWILLAGAAVGAAWFAHYYRLGLTVAHYDAKAHLVVARGIVDSLTPGYAQMGVNWLPLIHLLYLPFVIFDSQYRSGLLPSLTSVVSFALSGWLVFRISSRAAGSAAAGIFAALLVLANPNLEYLQSCPLTEPVYMLLELLSLDAFIRWRDNGGRGLPWLAAVWAALGGMCRYEGWVFAGGVLLLLGWDLWKRHLPRERIIRAGAAFAVVFAVPAAAHFGFIYARLGDIFFQRVAHGNPSPYETYHRPILALLYHVGELWQTCALIPLLAGCAGVVLVFARRDQVRRHLPLLILWLPSLVNVSALYWGMIYRVRYSVLLVPAVAVFAALLVSAPRWTKAALALLSLAAMALPWLSWAFPREWKFHFLSPGPGLLIVPAAALVLLLAAFASGRFRLPLLALCVLAMQLPVLSGEDRPILAETLEHSFIEPERAQVLQVLRRGYDGTRILIDMGKLAPLIYDSGLPVKSFVINEGTSSHWERAMLSPESEVGWICAQQGDEVWNHLRDDPHWAEAYSLAVRTESFSILRLKANMHEDRLPAK